MCEITQVRKSPVIISVRFIYFVTLTESEKRIHRVPKVVFNSGKHIFEVKIQLFINFNY